MPAMTAPNTECGNDVRQIKTETVRNMVEPFGNREIKYDTQYGICRTQDCPVVDFTGDHDQQFEMDVIRERPDSRLDADADPYLLCYYFVYNKEHIREEIVENGETTTADWITERVQVKECVCKWKSPLGGCCVGNVRATISEATEAHDIE